MSKPKRSKAERSRDLVLIAGLYLRGYAQHLIADEVNVAYKKDDQISRRQIGYDIKALHKQWRESQLIDIDDAKSRELARIDKLEFAAWEAWERSQQATQVFIEEMGGKKGAAVAKVRIETRGIATAGKAEKPKPPNAQTGDPRFLAIVDKCIDKRIRIFGLAAPMKQDLSGLDDVHIVVTIGGVDGV